MQLLAGFCLFLDGEHMQTLQKRNNKVNNRYYDAAVSLNHEVLMNEFHDVPHTEFPQKFSENALCCPTKNRL